MVYPFEVSFTEVQSNLDVFVDAVFSSLESEFMTLPRGQGFIEYPVFEKGYQTLKKATHDFQDVSSEVVIQAVYQTPISFIVLRTILGFTPPEWAYVTSQRTATIVPQGAVRTLDRKIRIKPLEPLSEKDSITGIRISSLVSTACQILAEGVPPATPGFIHRLDKADTRNGLASLRPVADLGMPYAMVLYERFLGRPFAGHRDSVSELVGDVLETAVEGILSTGKISYRKTKRAEKVNGFDQTPDFIIPDEYNPSVVIEAKITEDDGTARDKVTRVQHLGELSMKGLGPDDAPRFEVVACIAGRGFKVRREDMKKLLLATKGKVFTLRNLDRLIDCTQLAGFRTR